MNDIYYAEDDGAIAQAVKIYLEQKGFRVTVFHTIKGVKQALREHTPAMVLADWNMPDGQGDELCLWIRQRWEKLPVIFLTVRETADEIVSCFRKGADDYVVKPFELEVLYSRILAVLRRSGYSKRTVLSCGPISLNKEKMSAFYGQEELTLSQAEYHLLLLLMENKGRTVTRGQLLEQIWDSNGSFVNDNTLTVAMKRLREKLHHPSCLKTIRSFGYRMEEGL